VPRHPAPSASAARPAPALIAALFLLAWAAPAAAQPIRIGCYDNPPKIFIDESGKTAGFLADITEAIMESSGLTYTWVRGSWLECLARLESGAIDAMVDVAYSAERERIYAFNAETVFINWGVVYARRGLEVESFLDLEGLVIACMKGSIHTEGADGIIELARAFGVEFAYLPVESYREAWLAVEEGRADAAVVNRLFGLEREKTGRLERTNIYFNPTSIKYAFNRASSRSAALVPIFDTALRELKAKRDSAYYAALDAWVPGFVERREIVPRWLRVALPSIAAALAIALAFVAVLAREIARRRRLESELLRAKDAAESASRAKGAFLANTSHEIRTPLNAILGYAQLLESDPGLPEEQRRGVERIRSGGEHLLSVINEILDLSKIESGRAALVEAPFDLAAALRGAVELTELKAREKGLALETALAPGLPELVFGDEGKLRQILINLLGNAVKFTESGWVRLSVEPLEDSGGPTIRFTVSDSGPGIAPEDRERIFDAFEQASAGTVAREGTGLGLSVSRQLAALLGGTLTLSSELGRGSAFALTARLPRCDAPAAPAALASRDSAGRAGRILRASRPAAVLIADDRESNRDILARMLAPYGFDILEAVDGEEALRIFAQRRPELVLLDLLMPRLGGREALAAMRELETEAAAGGAARAANGVRAANEVRAGIIVLTAGAVEEERGDLAAAGADDCLGKPFRRDDLLESIARLFPMERAQAGAEPRRDVAARDPAAEAALLRAQAAALDGGRRASLAKAVALGDIAGLRHAARELAGAAPALAAAAAAAADSFDLRALSEALARE